MKFLVTGGAGFIGSNYLHYVVDKYPEETLHYPNNTENKDNFKFVKGNINDRDLIYKLFEEEKFDYVINFAAESHVDNSIKNPNLFADTNILGTMTLMNAAKIYGIKRYQQVSTDEG